MRLYTDESEDEPEVTAAKATNRHNFAKKSTENVEEDLFGDSESEAPSIIGATPENSFACLNETMTQQMG